MRAGSRAAQGWLLVYVGALALIALWPVHIDRGASGMIGAITDTLPWLTYGRIELAANILLFVPFGFLLTAVFAGRVVLPLAIAVGATILIEVAQGVLPIDRTPSVLDVVANSSGAVIGVALATVVLGVRRRTDDRRRRRERLSSPA